MEGDAVISHEVLAAYARDAAREVDGVDDLVARPRRSGGVHVAEEDGKTTVEIHVSVAWGVNAAEVGQIINPMLSWWIEPGEAEGNYVFSHPWLPEETGGSVEVAVATDANGWPTLAGLLQARASMPELVEPEPEPPLEPVE